VHCISTNSVDIIIPTYNGSARLVQVLESIERQISQPYQCFVVDDGSDESPAHLIAHRFPWAYFIQTSRNRGPAYARNLGVRQGTAPYLCLLDDDVYLEDDDWLQNAVCIMSEHPHIGQIASMILSSHDPEILLDCGIFRSPDSGFGALYWRKHVEHVHGKHLVERAVLGACSAASVVRRDAFEKVGGFDHKYYYICEDLDLSVRIYLAGYDIVYQPSLRAYHVESAMMGTRQQMKEHLYSRNQHFVILDNYPLRVALKHFLLVARETLVSFLRCIPFARLKQPHSIHAMRSKVKLVAEVVRALPNIVSKRWRLDRVRERSRYSIIELNARVVDETRLSLPVRTVIFSVTNECNAKCGMCFQQRVLNTASSLMGVQEIRLLFNSMNNLQVAVIGGGEPCMRKDLAAVCTSILAGNPTLHITLATNGSFPSRLYRTCRDILSRGQGNVLVSMSLDGSPDYHDRNRGVTSLFNSVQKSYSELLKLKAVYGERLGIQINTCVTRDNLKEIDFLSYYLSRRMQEVSWIIEPVRGGFEEKTATPLSLDEWKDLRLKLERLQGLPIERTKAQLIDLYTTAIETLCERKQVVRCMGGTEFICVDHNGNVRPCEIMDSPFVNAADLDYDVNNLNGHLEWQQAIERIKDRKCYCTHFCWLMYSIQSDCSRSARTSYLSQLDDF
jgi:GT2 family glycosyltransferase/MoaA/NifB/PqqE/SkfB family radical SAM enzyme